MPVTQQHRIIAMLASINNKVDLLIDELPAEKKANLKNAILETQYQDALLKAPNDGKPLKQFLTDNPQYIKTQHPQLKTRQPLKDTQTRQPCKPAG